MSSRSLRSDAAGAALAADPAETSSMAVLYVPAPRARAAVEERLTAAHRSVVTATDITAALQRLAEGRFDVCLVDLVDGRASIPLIRMVQSQHPTVPVVAIADPASPAMAAEALYSGAIDALPWPFEDADLAAALTNARDRSGVVLPAVQPSRVFTYSPAMRHTMEQVQAASSAWSAVGMFGEPGTGRLLVARALHAASFPVTPDAFPFAVVDCAQGGPQTIETRLFGAEPDRRRADDGAVERLGRSGAIVDALGGTLVVRNLSEAPARVQARLARLLRDREALLAGKRQVTELDLRAVAIFDLETEGHLDDGRLRRDLFERFATRRIDVPPLRRRREDIPVLAVHILAELSRTDGRPGRSLSRAAMTLLAALPWRGNVPELRQLLETLARAARRPVIQLDHILEHAQLDGLGATIDPGVTLRDAKARFERDCISAVLMRHHGRVGEAAKALGIQRTNLYRKVRQLNVARSLLSARK